MASRREQILQAVLALGAAALPGADVVRNQDKPARIGPGGRLIIRDGDPGEPEVDLSPLAYNYAHRIPLEVAHYEAPGVTREEALDDMLTALGAGVEADRTLGGLVDFLETAAPATDDTEVEGARSSRWADAALVAHYRTTSPL